jgi:hypothetical protein
MSLLDTASLIVTPNGYKEGKLYSVIPSDGSGDLSVTRATTATRVNSAGLVELVPYNLLSYSQDLTNAAWSLIGTITRTANYGTAPDGTTTSTRIQWAGSSNYELYQYSGKATPVYGSVYVKGTSGQTINFNGSLKTFNGEWQRIENSLLVDGTNTYMSIRGISGTTTALDFQIWGAQAVEGSTAKDYQKTETRLNIPRLDYSNGTCPSLLVEPQRTNLLTYSSSFDSSDWVKQSGVSVTANQAISPDGTQNADLVTGNGTSGLFQANKSVSTTIANTKSVWLKGVSGGEVVVLQDPNQTNNTLNCNLTTNWQRFTLSEVQSTGGAGLWVTNIPSGGVYMWGAQLENAPYPTSYIPTTSASVTRNADVISKTGISSLIGQTEGTLFLDFVFKTPSGNTEGQAAIKSGSGDDRVIIWNNFTLNSLALQIKANGTNIVGNVSLGSFVDGTRYKIAVAYKSGDISAYVNGSQIIADTSTFSFASSVTDFIVGGYYLPYNGHQLNNATALWKTRLTNTQLAQLTTI